MRKRHTNTTQKSTDPAICEKAIEKVVSTAPLLPGVGIIATEYIANICKAIISIADATPDATALPANAFIIK